MELCVGNTYKFTLLKVYYYKQKSFEAIGGVIVRVPVAIQLRARNSGISGLQSHGTSFSLAISLYSNHRPIFCAFRDKCTC